MATHYSCSPITDREGRELYYVLKTHACNIKLVNLYNQCKKPKYIRNTDYYGMNASFFSVANGITLTNIAYQDGKCIGSGTTTEDGYKDGYVNKTGTGLIYWTGSQLKYADKVLFGSSSLIPKDPGSWAQGGYNIYLCDKNWKDKFLAQYGASDLDGLKPTPRTAALINTDTGYVYLFASKVFIYVSDIRKTMMEYAGLTEGGNSGPWKAILTDGGASTQMRCATVDYYIRDEGLYSGRPVPEIFSLIETT